MAVYYQIVCHRCRTRYSPTLSKLREMQINESVAAEIGRFVLEHQHGQWDTIELIGDSLEENWDVVSNYKEQKTLDKGE